MQNGVLIVHAAQCENSIHIFAVYSQLYLVNLIAAIGKRRERALLFAAVIHWSV